jgi:glutamate dehydrogenase
MTSIAVRPDGSDLEYRFVGLLGSAAYRESVFAIPVVGERATEVVERIGASVATYTGRAVRNVVETLPRDIVFELDPQPLHELVSAIVGLQERRIVRLFDVSEPVGPWTLVLVYIPRSRYVADLPERVADLVSEHYGGDTRDLEVLLGTSSLVRIAMTVRAPRLERPDELVADIDAASTTWAERVREALFASLGEIEGQWVFSTAARSVPADYQARVDIPHRASFSSLDRSDRRRPRLFPRSCCWRWRCAEPRRGYRPTHHRPCLPCSPTPARIHRREIGRRA